MSRGADDHHHRVVARARLGADCDGAASVGNRSPDHRAGETERAAGLASSTPAIAPAATASPARGSRVPRPGAGDILGAGPSLRGVGALAADFYLRRGYMPLSSIHDQPGPDKVLFSDQEISSLVQYVASLGQGPAVPNPTPATGSLSAGQQMFTLHCAGCHQIDARGGYVTGARVPPLQSVPATQIAEAVRIGPYLMPRFSTQRDLQPAAQLDHPIRAEHQPSRQPRRLGDRQHRSDSRGARRLVDRRPAAGALLPDGRKEATSMKTWQWFVALMSLIWRRCAAVRRPPEPRLRATPARRSGSSRPARRTAEPRTWCWPCSGSRLCSHSASWRPMRRSAPADLPMSCWGSASACALVHRCRSDRGGETAGGHRGARGRLPARASPAAAGGRRDHPGERQPNHPKAPAAERRRGDRRRARPRGADARAVVGAGRGTPGRLDETPWRRGVRVVDVDGRPIRAADIEQQTFYTGFPEGADPENIGSPLVIIRVESSRSSSCPRDARTGRRAGSWPTRRSAPTPAARSRCTASRRSRRSSPSRARMSVPLLDV